MSTEQTRFDPSVEEREIFTALSKNLEGFLQAEHIPSSAMGLSGTKADSAIKLSTLVICRLCFRKKGKRYYAVPVSYSNALGTHFAFESKKDMMVCYIDQLSDEDLQRLAELLKDIIRQAVYSLPKEFDCCHLYEQCSDAKRCVQDDWSYALGCGYQRIMKRGKYFYGKNRNV